MNAFIRAREELYTRLYRRFVDKDGPYYGMTEFDSLCEKPGMNAARLFAKDMGHLKNNRPGDTRLTAQGVLYAEEQGYCPGGDE